MHIPDGFLSPQTYLPAYAVAAGAWGWAARGLRERLDETTRWPWGWSAQRPRSPRRACWCG